jgi:hypothetical protein
MGAGDAASAAANLFTSGGLGVAGAVALLMARAPGCRSIALPPMVALLAGVALIALAFDEGLELHDRVGRWLWREHEVTAPLPVNHVDDVIVFAYIAAAGVAGVLLLPTLARRPRFLAGLLLSGALMSCGAVIDAFGTPESWTDVPEEALETGGAVLVAAVFATEAGLLRRIRPHRASGIASLDGLRFT